MSQNKAAGRHKVAQPLMEYQTLLVVNLVVGQGLATFCASNGRTSTPCTTRRAGVVPYAFCILRRLWCLGGVGNGSYALWQCGICGRRSLSRICRSWWVVGCVVRERGTTFCASNCRASATFTALWAGVMPYASRILGRLRRGRRSGVRCWVAASGLTSLYAFNCGVTGGIAIVFARNK